VSVVFPVYNEEEGVVDACNDFFASGYVDEIVAVDNNSSDRSAELISGTEARLVAESRQGYGYALRRGLHPGRARWHVHGQGRGKVTGLLG
jgi:glycosyltransferase involved in cell wall biosynthesis